MNKLLKIALLFVSCATFSSISYADARQDLIAKGVASMAKQGLIEDQGKFPIQVDDVSYLMNITSHKQYVVCD